MLSSVTIEKRPSRLSVVGASLNNLTLKFTMCTTQELLAFVRQLPIGIAYAPIYANTCPMQSGKLSKGKTPFERAHNHVMTPADVALQIERRPEVFQAVGIFAGPRSKGIVFLDVDRNLSRLRKKWKDTLEGAPVVTSTKSNAAKYLFRVPEELWGQVKGFGLSDTGAGYEVLWGRQGLIYGAYPGSSDGKAPAGSYGFEGDLENVPVAPEWLLAEMRDAARREVQDAGFIKNRKALDFSDRDPAEVAEMIQCALKVIPGQGIGSRDHWIKVGMAIHSELPGDLGLTLWSAWSAEDPEYAGEWTENNPCEPVWNSFRKGPVSLGTLFWMADQQMPGRLWLPEDLRKVVVDVESDNVTRIRQVTIEFPKLVAKAREIQELDNPAEMAHRMNALALEANYRDAGALERLLIAQVQYEQQDDDMDIGYLIDKDIKLEYLIPDLLPLPGVVMIHGAGGDGKSMTAWTLAKHVARGLPFSVRGDFVPVKQGNVLILNGDQSEVQVKQQMMELELGHNDPIRVVMGWDINWYFRFIALVKKHQPALIVIDSITGCSRGSAFDENKKEFAGPIYWLANNNGRLFPACTIVLIHHSNKSGGFRGTTALRDAVDEVWSLKKPSDKEMEQTGPSCRLIGIEKSRAGRGGSKLLLKMLDDLTFELKDYVDMVMESGSPASVVDRVLQRLRVASKAGEGRTRTELNSDPLCGGSVGGIKKALQRLECRGLITSKEEASSIKPGNFVKRYFALLSRDIYENMCPPSPKTSLELDSQGGQPPTVSPLKSTKKEKAGAAPVQQAAETAKQGGHENGCPPSDASDSNDLARGDKNFVTPQSSTPYRLRTDAELIAIREAAEKFWDG